MRKIMSYFTSWYLFIYLILPLIYHCYILSVMSSTLHLFTILTMKTLCLSLQHFSFIWLEFTF